jgi:hypothetical protein
MATKVPPAPVAVPEAAGAAAVQPAIEENELVLGDTIIKENDANTETSTICQILHWIGFRIEAHRENLREESLGSMHDMLSLTEKDVLSISSDWANRTAALGQFHIGTKQLKSLQLLIHWIQDFHHVSGTPSIVSLNEYTFKAQLTQALDRSVIHKSLKDQTVTTSSEALPGPLENECKWKQWEEKFVNYT